MKVNRCWETPNKGGIIVFSQVKFCEKVDYFFLPINIYSLNEVVKLFLIHVSIPSLIAI